MIRAVLRCLPLLVVPLPALADAKAEPIDFYFVDSGTAPGPAVLWLSVQHGLGARFDGQVEDQTAKLLNELLRKYGGLPEPMVFAIKGRVIWGDNTRFLTGVRIRAFAAQAAGEEPLGEAETEESGVCHAA